MRKVVSAGFVRLCGLVREWRERGVLQLPHLKMDVKHRSIKPERLLQVCWLIANAEAKELGAAEILPIHFLLAVMKVIDPEFPNQLDKLSITSEDWATMCREAQSVRRYIDVLPERVTEKRRGLRRRLAAKRENPPVVADGMLHRSAALKRAFSDACMFTEGDALTFLKLVESLFELELVSLDDIKG